MSCNREIESFAYMTNNMTHLAKQFKGLMKWYRLKLFIMSIPFTMCVMVLIYSIFHSIVKIQTAYQLLVMFGGSCIISLQAFAESTPICDELPNLKLAKCSYVSTVVLDYVAVCIIMYKYYTHHYFIAGFVGFVGIFAIGGTISLFKKVHGYRLAKTVKDIASVTAAVKCDYGMDKYNEIWDIYYKIIPKEES